MSMHSCVDFPMEHTNGGENTCRYNSIRKATFELTFVCRYWFVCARLSKPNLLFCTCLTLCVHGQIQLHVFLNDKKMICMKPKSLNKFQFENCSNKQKFSIEFSIASAERHTGVDHGNKSTNGVSTITELLTRN